MNIIAVGMSIMLCLLTAACSKKSPTTSEPPSTTMPPANTTPPPSSAPTRIIRLGGDMNFGNISLAGSPVKETALIVSNDGNETLEVTGMSGPCAGTYLTVPGSTSFPVAPGGSVSVGFRFAPRVRVDCSGTITVFGNQTSGTNTIAVRARGVLPGCETAPEPLPPPCVPLSERSSS
jgi:hypothetical protein